MVEQTAERPVFILGLPRTGTTITRAVLNASPLVRIGGESKFLPDRALLGLGRREGYREKFRRAGDITTEDGIARLVDYVYTQQESNYWKRFAASHDRAEFASKLRASDRSDKAVLDIAMRHFAQGRPIRGDKSPQHIYSIPRLLEWFPEAVFIHTFRDPRAIYVSVQRKAETRRSSLGQLATRIPGISGAYSMTSVITNWRHVAHLHREYQSRFGDRYVLLRYEDLVASPEESARRLSEVVGIPFIGEMLDQSVINSSFVARGATSGFDSSSVERWREYLSPSARRWFAFLCAKEMREFGYEA
jgi:hypothetical protein